MDNKTQERIKADALTRYPPRISSPRFMVEVDMNEGRRLSYIAGATTENDRAQVLVDALEWIKTFGPVDELTVKFIDKQIAQWKTGKEVEPVKEDNICGMCKERPKGDGISVCNECYYSFDGDRRGFWDSED